MKEQQEIRISEAEWSVMEALWDGGDLTPAQLIKRLEATTDWNHRTIRSLLSRLLSKGAVARSKDTGINLYRARLRRDDCIRRESEGFVRRVFKGDVRSLLEHFDDAEVAGIAGRSPRKKGAGRGSKALRQVIDTFFGGSVEDAFAAHVTRDEELDHEQLERLAKLIDEAKKKGK